MRLAKENGFDEVVAGRASIVVNELATNILRHAARGEVLVQVIHDGGDFAELEVLAIDRGPGMRDVSACLRDGFSTAGTSGQGLGAATRLSDTFDVYSVFEKGSVLLSRFSRRQKSPPAVNGAAVVYGAFSVPLEGEMECGDTWRIAETEGQVAMFVADGLGHGPEAANASQAAADAFSSRPMAAPVETMKACHSAAGGTRGAAVACAQVHRAERKVAFAGVGNITGTVVTSERPRGMVSHNGIVGVQLLRTQQFDYEWPPACIVVMHSDGLSARWNLMDYPGLQHRHPSIIAAMLYRDFSRPRDDATVLVVCQQA